MLPIHACFVASLLPGMLLMQIPPLLCDRPSDARSAKDGRYISWREHRIDDELLSGEPIRGADGLAVADLDADGFPDVVSVHEDSNHVRIAFGSSDPDRWTNFTLDDGPSVRAVEDVDIGDANDDGMLDVAVACERHHMMFYQAPPKGRTRDMTAWTQVRLEATWDRGSWIRVKFGDMDGDGHLDILGANKGQGEIGELFGYSWFQAAGPTTQPEGWRENGIGRSRTPINIRPLDVDRDGDPDVLTGSRGEGSIWWYENLGRGQSWKRHTINTPPPRTTGFMMEPADLNRDGRVDFVTAADEGRAVWFEQPEDVSAATAWRMHVIGDVFPDNANGLALVDLNDDGRLDLFTGGYSDNPRETEPKKMSVNDSCGRLAWFEQPADPTRPWRRHDLSRRRRGMFDGFIPLDVNRDGLIDLVSTRGNTGNLDGVFWLEQVRTAEPVPVFRRARAEDSKELPLPEEGRRSDE